MGNPARGASVSTPTPLTDLEQDIADKVDKFGCMVMHVFDPEGQDPDFSYSIGLPTKIDQPDVIVFGLKKSLMHSMINELFRQCRDEGLKLADGTRVSGLIDGFDCVAKRVRDETAIQEHFGSAIWYDRRFNDRTSEHAFQIVWPGAVEGLFPWEAGCDPYVIDQQPALYQGQSDD